MNLTEGGAAAVVTSLRAEEAEIGAILAVIEKPRDLLQPEVMRAWDMLTRLKARYRTLLRPKARNEVAAHVQRAIRRAYVEIRVRPGSHPRRHPWGTHLRAAIDELVYYRERIEKAFPMTAK